MIIDGAGSEKGSLRLTENRQRLIICSNFYSVTRSRQRRAAPTNFMKPRRSILRGTRRKGKGKERGRRLVGGNGKRNAFIRPLAAKGKSRAVRREGGRASFSMPAVGNPFVAVKIPVRYAVQFYDDIYEYHHQFNARNDIQRGTVRFLRRQDTV
jgi:hypothetical protein